jgi:hypothetical protein
MADGTGCEMFMVDNKALQRTTAAVLVQKMIERPLAGSFEYGQLFLGVSKAVT